MIAVDGGTEEDVKSTSFNILNKIWKSKTISLNTKLKIFNSNVKSIQYFYMDQKHGGPPNTSPINYKHS